jgi:hypothetical protein
VTWSRLLHPVFYGPVSTRDEWPPVSSRTSPASVPGVPGPFMVRVLQVVCGHQETRPRGGGDEGRVDRR